MKDWLGVIGTILGVILGGSITWRIGHEQRKHDSAKEKRNLLLSKYEELYTLLGELQDGVNSYVAPLLSEATSKNQFDAKQIRRIPLEKIKMLIDFYVPELQSDQEYVKKQVDFLYEHVTKHLLEQNRTKVFLADSAITANELSKVTNKTVTSMKSKLALSATKYTKID